MARAGLLPVPGPGQPAHHLCPPAGDFATANLSAPSGSNPPSVAGSALDAPPPPSRPRPRPGPGRPDPPPGGASPSPAPPPPPTAAPPSPAAGAPGGAPPARPSSRRCRPSSPRRRPSAPPRPAGRVLSTPFHRASVSGKCWPRSPRPAAPRRASATAWLITSASLWPARPRSPSNTTPPSTSARPGSSLKGWTSKPRPTLVVTVRPPRVRQQGPGHDQVVGRRQLEVAGVALDHDHPCRRGTPPGRRRRWPPGSAPRVGPAQDRGPEGLRASAPPPAGCGRSSPPPARPPPA